MTGRGSSYRKVLVVLFSILLAFHKIIGVFLHVFVFCFPFSSLCYVFGTLPIWGGYIYIYIHMAPLNVFSNIASKFKSLTAGWLQRPNRPNLCEFSKIFFDGKTPTFSNESLEMLEILQVIHSKGDHSDSLLIVLRGGVRVCMGDECLRLHGWKVEQIKSRQISK